MLSQRGTEAFITSWLHFCNSLFADLPAISLRHLQLTLNITVETWISEHFACFLRELLWFHLIKWQFQVEINFLLASFQRCFPLLVILFSYYFICSFVPLSCFSSPSARVSFTGEPPEKLPKPHTLCRPQSEVPSSASSSHPKWDFVKGDWPGLTPASLQFFWQVLLGFYLLSLFVCDGHLHKSQA